MVTIRTRLFLAFLILVGLGFYSLVDWLLEDIRPRYLETMEESMVDTATILASVLSNQIEGDVSTVKNFRPAIKDLENFRTAFGKARDRTFSARIYRLTKTNLTMRVYVTDKTGIVIFDSDEGREEGKDYSRWNDVHRTLRGEYGARTSHPDPAAPGKSILYVAAPIIYKDEIAGVLTVCKPSDSLVVFIYAAKKKIIHYSIAAALSVVLLGLVFSFWITRPINRLTEYAKAVRDGKRQALPELGKNEIGQLGEAFEQMRDALEGKQYVESYIQTLTHEMKSPLSAIRGASELLQEKNAGGEENKVSEKHPYRNRAYPKYDRTSASTLRPGEPERFDRCSGYRRGQIGRRSRGKPGTPDSG